MFRQLSVDCGNLLIMEEEDNGTSKIADLSDVYCELTPSFLGMTDLKEEISRKINKGYKCDTCRKIFFMDEDLRRHIKFVHQYRKLLCSTCRISFKSLIALRRHNKSAHRIALRDFICAHCNSSYTRKYDLKKHIFRIHFDDIPFLCPTCGQKFKRKYYLDRHLKEIHNNNELFKCSFCKQAFKRKYQLKRHLYENDVHLDFDKFKNLSCPYCYLSFEEKCDLEKHFKEDHTCSSCGKFFDKTYQLKCHACKMRPSYPCIQCNSTFKKNSDFNRHVLEVHDQRNRLTCAICNHTFQRNYNLSRHMKRFHKLQSVLKCFCGQTFTRSANLKKHELTCGNKNEVSSLDDLHDDDSVISLEVDY